MFKLFVTTVLKAFNREMVKLDDVGLNGFALCFADQTCFSNI